MKKLAIMCISFTCAPFLLLPGNASIPPASMISSPHTVPGTPWVAEVKSRLAKGLAFQASALEQQKPQLQLRMTIKLQPRAPRHLVDSTGKPFIEDLAAEADDEASDILTQQDLEDRTHIALINKN